MAVATDDVNAFARLSRAERDEIIETPLSRLYKVWADMNILPKQEKSCDLSRSGVSLGVELVNGIVVFMFVSFDRHRLDPTLGGAGGGD